MGNKVLFRENSNICEKSEFWNFQSLQKPVVLGCTNDFNWFIKQFPGFSKQIVVYDVSIVYPCL